MFTKNQYHNAIKRLNAGLTQLKPDSDNCHICGDSGHQAWECHHNPLYMEQLAWKVYGGFWKCFHCGEIFIEEDKAREHFGDTDTVTTACLQV